MLRRRLLCLTVSSFRLLTDTSIVSIDPVPLRSTICHANTGANRRRSVACVGFMRENLATPKSLLRDFIFLKNVLSPRCHSRVPRAIYRHVTTARVDGRCVSYVPGNCLLNLALDFLYISVIPNFTRRCIA